MGTPEWHKIGSGLGIVPFSSFIVRTPKAQNAPSTKENPPTRLRKAIQDVERAIKRAVDFSEARLIETRETSQREELIGEETRIFDQSQTKASAVETIGLSHTAEWGVTIDTNDARAFGGNAEVKILGVGSVGGSIERRLTETYSSKWKQSTSRQQTTSISIPAGGKVRVTVRWRRIWQQGVVTLENPAGARASVPFEVTIMLGFDKVTEDLK
jgi:hypothetical protein